MEQRFIEVDISPYTIGEIEKFAFELCQKLPVRVEGIKRYKIDNGEKERVSLLLDIVY